LKDILSLELVERSLAIGAGHHYRRGKGRWAENASIDGNAAYILFSIDFFTFLLAPEWI
jgi:hypothetical protein